MYIHDLFCQRYFKNTDQISNAYKRRCIKGNFSIGCSKTRAENVRQHTSPTMDYIQIFSDNSDVKTETKQHGKPETKVRKREREREREGGREREGISFRSQFLAET